MQGSPQDDPVARARLRGKRIALAVFSVVASVFVAISTYQITVAVFGIGARPVERSSPGGQECARGVHRLQTALDRAMTQSITAGDRGAAQTTFRTALSPEWDAENAVEQRCSEDPRGADAFAALRRLRVAEEALIRRQVSEIAPIRRDVAAYLPD